MGVLPEYLPEKFHIGVNFYKTKVLEVMLGKDGSFYKVLKSRTVQKTAVMQMENTAHHQAHASE